METVAKNARDIQQGPMTLEERQTPSSQQHNVNKVNEHMTTCPHSYINDNNQLTICVIIIIMVKIAETLQIFILVSTAHPKIPIWRTL